MKLTVGTELPLADHYYFYIKSHLVSFIVLPFTVTLIPYSLYCPLLEFIGVVFEEPTCRVGSNSSFIIYQWYHIMMI